MLVLVLVAVSAPCLSVPHLEQWDAIATDLHARESAVEVLSAQDLLRVNLQQSPYAIVVYAVGCRPRYHSSSLLYPCRMPVYYC